MIKLKKTLPSIFYLNILLYFTKFNIKTSTFNFSLLFLNYKTFGPDLAP